MNTTPPPGSPEAIKLGCRCPVMDNHHGAGYMGIPGVYVYSGDCTLHNVSRDYEEQGITINPCNRGSAPAVGPVAETLPCPFCGGTDIRFTNHGPISRAMGHQNDDVWSTCCYNCGASFPNCYRRELLVAQWNRRPLKWYDQMDPLAPYYTEMNWCKKCGYNSFFVPRKG